MPSKFQRFSTVAALTLVTGATLSNSAGAQTAGLSGAPETSPAVIQGAWTNRSLSADERAQAALKAMTREEKLALLRTPMPAMQRESSRLNLPIGAGHIYGVPRLGIAPVAETDASLGVSNLGGARNGDVATALPSSLALGASWDPELAFRGGAMIGSEARAKGFGVMLAGGVNLIRDPRAGRNFEYISEDPLLTGVLGGNAIAGVQSNRIVSTLKHFAANHQETGRNVHSVNMPEAELRESELLASEIANQIGHPGSVMCAYNKVNDVYACENKFLLTDVLRRDWGFSGFVMSDWGAVHSTEALLAGLDQQSGYQLDRKPYFGAELEKALADGRISESSVDSAALRILRTLFEHGVVDAPPVPGASIDYDANSNVALAQAEAGIVLLRNEGDLLPIASSAKRIAVIGGHADVGVLAGGGSSEVIPVGGRALEMKLPGGGIHAVVRRAYGGTAPLAAIKAAFPQASVDFDHGTDPAAAARLAATADVAIVFGEKWFYETTDSPDMALGEGQDQLIEAVARANPRTIVVLQTGNPVAMPWLDRVPAILTAWYPGQRGGEAIARVLSGTVNPSGHLPVTWPVDVHQLPDPRMPGSDVPKPTAAEKANYGFQADRVPFSITYREGSDAGYRWFHRTGANPLFAFGHGLSYTRFQYDRLKVRGGPALSVSFRVRNTGRRPGADVVQVYAVPPGRTRRLVGWAKLDLAPGQSKQVTVVADPRLLAKFDASVQEWIVPSGNYVVEVGESAAAIKLQHTVKLPLRKIPVNEARKLNAQSSVKENSIESNKTGW